MKSFSQKELKFGTFSKSTGCWTL